MSSGLSLAVFPPPMTERPCGKQAWPVRLTQLAWRKSSTPFNNCFQQIVTEHLLWPHPNIMSLGTVYGIWCGKLISKAEPNKLIQNRESNKGNLGITLVMGMEGKQKIGAHK